ncbi:DUF1403 family protein [Pseudogemmobacter humi]|uniref:DUF1403 family protein n=1 Tax=Pseudogemmobacter humi TaxID=2483812 RepID=UPI000F51E7F7|nr:DUF1403 family protein [Pseudogemmobacter humi]
MAQALSAAAAVSRLEERREGEAQLRDAFVLRKPGDDPGPAARMLIGLRALGEARALRSVDWPLRLPGLFDLAPEPSAEILRDRGARFVGRTPPLRQAAEVAREVLAPGPARRGLALWLAAAALARALGGNRTVESIQRKCRKIQAPTLSWRGLRLRAGGQFVLPKEALHLIRYRAPYVELPNQSTKRCQFLFSQPFRHSDG